MKILVRLPNWLGDVVMATGFLQALHEQYPGAEIHIILKKELAVIAEYIPQRLETHLFSKTDFPGIKGAFQFGKSLRKYNFELFFSLPDSFSSALIGWATGAKKRIGYKNELRSLLLTHVFQKDRGKHRVLEYISLLEKFAAEEVVAPRTSLSVQTTAPLKERLILLNFNSEASSRRMPKEKAISLVEKIIRKFPDYTIGLLGAPKELPFIQSIIAAFETQPTISNFAGKTSLKGLIELLGKCSVLLTTDSGPAHLANSIGTPTIVLFGAGNEQNTAPFNTDSLAIIRAGTLSCEPCVKNVCPLYELPECMNQLNEPLILETLTKFVNK